jgi:Spy/CpxP family protein refolding chaperone
MADTSKGAPGARAILAIGIVFALGAVLGAALTFAVLRVAPGPAPAGPMAGPGSGPGLDHPPRRAVMRMFRQLDLDPEQREQVEQILLRSRRDVREVLEQSRSEIREVLTPEQREAFDDMAPARPLPHRDGPRRPRWRRDR